MAIAGGALLALSPERRKQAALWVEWEQLKCEIRAISGISEVEADMAGVVWDLESVKWALLAGSETAETLRTRLKELEERDSE